MTLDRALLDEVTQFVYREARLQDEHRYAEWEQLWTDDGLYWVPANGDDIDPEHQMSILYDNRSRISIRVRQLMTGRRLAQTPQSRLRRIVSNVEILGVEGPNVRVTSNAMLFESNARGDTIWASRNEHKLRRDGDGWRMAAKTVVLVNNEAALYSMAFLI